MWAGCHHSNAPVEPSSPQAQTAWNVPHARAHTIVVFEELTHFRQNHEFWGIVIMP